jgi:hypothetical protein
MRCKRQGVCHTKVLSSLWWALEALCFLPRTRPPHRRSHMCFDAESSFMRRCACLSSAARACCLDTAEHPFHPHVNHMQLQSASGLDKVAPSGWFVDGDWLDSFSCECRAYTMQRCIECPRCCNLTRAGGWRRIVNARTYSRCSSMHHLTQRSSSLPPPQFPRRSLYVFAQTAGVVR